MSDHSEPSLAHIAGLIDNHAASMNTSLLEIQADMWRLDGSMLALRADVQALRMEIRATNSPVER
jgi:hypothetical protein